MADVLEVLPPRWREDRMILGDRVRWDAVEVLGDDDGVVLLIGGPDRPSVLGRGDPATVDRLVAGADVGPGPVDERAAGLPTAARHARRSRPGPVLHLGLALDGCALPPHVPGGGRGPPARPRRDADAIRACLREANPETSADPAGPDELGWWGVHVDGVLAGVVGGRSAGRRRRRPVLARARSRRPADPAGDRGGDGPDGGGAPARACAAGASWVSLGMYAQNDAARRIYRGWASGPTRRCTSFSAGGTLRPPA